MKKAAIAVLALPVLGLVASLVSNEVALRNATEWRIPITGYDPRDPLRGRFIQFQYSWAATGDPRLCDREGCRLCLEAGGRAVRISPRGATCPAGVDPRASNFSVFNRGTGQVSASTRLWVSEARAPVLEAQLRDQPMVAVARLTSGGRLVPLRLVPDK